MPLVNGLSGRNDAWKKQNDASDQNPACKMSYRIVKDHEGSRRVTGRVAEGREEDRRVLRRTAEVSWVRGLYLLLLAGNCLLGLAVVHVSFVLPPHVGEFRSALRPPSQLMPLAASLNSETGMQEQDCFASFTYILRSTIVPPNRFNRWATPDVFVKLIGFSQTFSSEHRLHRSCAVRACCFCPLVVSLRTVWARRLYHSFRPSIVICAVHACLCVGWCQSVIVFWVWQIRESSETVGLPARLCVFAKVLMCAECVGMQKRITICLPGMCCTRPNLKVVTESQHQGKCSVKESYKGGGDKTSSFSLALY